MPKRSDFVEKIRLYLFFLLKNIAGKAIFTIENHAKNKYNLIFSTKIRLFDMPKINII